jgi:putative zinc finger/helix-turn-helix YgiT family protein
MSTMPDQLQSTQVCNGSPGDRPFPWRCPKCLQKTVSPALLAYRAKARHDGAIFEWDIPDLRIPQCAACGELVFSNHADVQISQSLRAHLRLLTPEQIEKTRRQLGLSQKDLSERLGSTEETLNRWEEGTLIQSRAMDNLLRVFFALPAVRSVLTGANQDPGLGLVATQCSP